MFNKRNNIHYVAIEGNIGAGKTSLATILSNLYHGSLVLENFAENTFLKDFYMDQSRFAFPLEMSFLAERYRQLMSAQRTAEKDHTVIISDYIFDKSLIFARANLSSDEFSLFQNFYEIMTKDLKPPDLTLYIKRNTDSLKKNIQKRGREFEKDIDSAYLSKINKEYENYFEKSDIHVNTKLIIDAAELDFVNEPSDLRFLITEIEKPRSQGLFYIKK